MKNDEKKLDRERRKYNNRKRLLPHKKQKKLKNAETHAIFISDFSRDCQNDEWSGLNPAANARDQSQRFTSDVYDVSLGQGKDEWRGLKTVAADGHRKDEWRGLNPGVNPRDQPKGSHWFILTFHVVVERMNGED